MRSIDDLDVAGRRVLVRVDFNVPLKDGTVVDDARIRAALPTIQELRDRGARVLLVAHLGRPRGRADEALSLAPVAARLSELLGVPVRLAPGVMGEEVERFVSTLGDGEVGLLENVRFLPGEVDNDPAVAAGLAALADRYVNDAFGAAHRAHASTEGVVRLLPSAAGRLLEREVGTLRALLDEPARPLVAVIGGAKVKDKIGVLDRFMERADTILIGGAMCFAFLAAEGHTVGDSLYVEEDIDHARALLAAARAGAARLELPSDLVIATALSAEAPHRVLVGVDVPDGWMGLDIGPDTVRHYGEAVAQAGTVFWNGPMGAFELEPFAAGTQGLALAVARARGKTVIGGGDSGAAIRQFGLEGEVDYVSTGGGAALELIEGKDLPGIEALEGAPHAR